MSVKMKGLGKGLSALFADTGAEYEQTSAAAAPAPSDAAKPQVVEVEKIKFVSDGKPSEINISLIDPNPSQPRKHFESGALNELADSIRLHGIIQPIILAKKDGRYIIIAGERRWRAARLAGLAAVPAVVRAFNDRQVKELALIENLQREDLNPIEAAEAISQLMTIHNLTQDQVAERIGKSRPAVANQLRLLSLSQEVIGLVRDGRLSSGHARCLVPVTDTDRQTKLALAACDNQLSVRELEKLAGAEKAQANGSARQAPKKPQEPQSSLELKDLVQTMQRVLGTKVSAVGNQSKGRITIDYFSADDIDRIYHLFERLRR